MGKKRGQFFTIDAILAAGIIFVVLILVSKSYVSEPNKVQVSSMSQDSIRVFTNLKIAELDNDYVKNLTESGEITRINNTILEQIGEFWAEGKLDTAKKLASNLSDSLIPSRFGFGIYVDGEEIFLRDKDIQRSLISSRKIISGIEKSKPRFGISSKAFLQSIDYKKTNAYVYFGGFEGQGNLTKSLELIPDDAIIDSVFMQLQAGTDFNLYINNNYCGNFIPIKLNMSPTFWNVTSCKNFFTAGIENEIGINFTGLLNESYVSGGYIRLKYRTKETFRNQTEGIDYYYFPGIDGLINLYSSFDIPGTLQYIDLYLHFYNNKTTYLTIGNTTLFNSSGSSSDQIVNISSIAFPANPETIPIRMGVGEISEAYNTTSGEPSDSVLVTDVSGSMNDCGEYSTTQVCRYECRVCWWFFCWWEWRECPYIGSCSGDQCGTCSSGNTRNHEVVNSDTCIKTKLDMAKEADLDFIGNVLNLTGNEVGLVSYESNVDSIEPITDIEINLQNEINSYTAGGGTCICCGINRAKDMLLPSTDKRFMVVMSDGAATMYCDDFFDYTGSGTGGSSDAIDKQWAIDAGQNACNQDITVFSVGFGEDADQDTLKQIACNESLYYNATNSSELSQIYQNISDQINIIANYSSQIISVQGDYKKSVLYPDSFIRFNYTPIVDPPTFGEIEIVEETDKFNTCTPTVSIPNGTRAIEVKILSYSGPHWTSYLSVNGNQIFNITKHGLNYRSIGDPFVMQIPADIVHAGDNNIEVLTADSPNNNTGCSDNNSMVYTLLIKSYIDYGAPLTNATGCYWTIEMEDGTYNNLKSPQDYTGSQECSFNSTSSSYNSEDSYHVAVYNILSQLDFDDDGKLDINFEENDLVIDFIVIRDVPSLWGPSVVEIRVWE